MSYSVRQRRFVAGRIVLTDELLDEVRDLLGRTNGGVDRENVTASVLDHTKVADNAATRLLANEESAVFGTYTATSDNLEPLLDGGDPWVVEFDSLDEFIRIHVFAQTEFLSDLVVLLDGVPVAATRSGFSVTVGVPVGAGPHRLDFLLGAASGSTIGPRRRCVVRGFRR